MIKAAFCRTRLVVLAIFIATAIAAHGQTVTTLVIFDVGNGADPAANLVQGIDGNFYGTTRYGGPHNDGTIFKMTPEGKMALLHKFDGNDGEQPTAGLALGADGNFYGTTYGGGLFNGYLCPIYGCGTVFKITSGGTLTTLYSFCPTNCTDGAIPAAGLVQGMDGTLYGTTTNGGTFADGTVFKISPQGTLTTLQAFDGTDGWSPSGPVIQGTDGNFYGTTYFGGANGQGAVFKITPGGVLTTLYNFCAEANCTDGAQPNFIVQATDGNFYGTTWHGGVTTLGVCGTPSCGTVFKLTPTGVLTTLYKFCQLPQCADGYFPGSLIEATNGTFYGTTIAGGTSACVGGCGTIFTVTSDGTLTTLYSFCAQVNCPDGEEPNALLQSTNGGFYGTTYVGGEQNNLNGYGTAFSLDMGLGPFVSFVHSFGAVGKTADLLGQGFTGATGVSFNGVPATFTVRRDTFLTATVPSGATTGYVTVTTRSGTLTSNVPFHVLP